MASTLTISWTAPTPCVGCTYEYRYKLSSDTTFISGSTSNTSVVISSLTDGATYNYQVRTVCGPVRSLWSTSSTVTCDTAPTPAPTVAPTQTPAPTVAPTTPPTTPAPTVAPCGAPTISSVTRSGLNDISVGFTTSSGCVATHLEYSLDNSSWSSQNSGGCTSPRTLTISPNNQSIVYVRMRQSCQGVDYSSYSNVFTLAAVVTQTPEPTVTPTIQITNCVRLVKRRPVVDPNCSFTRTQSVTVTLYDSTGANVQNASYDVTVTLDVDGPEGEPTTWDLVIPPGQSSVTDEIVTSEQTSGNCTSRDGTAVTRVVGGITSISNPSIVECTGTLPPPPGVTLNAFYYGQGLPTSIGHCGTNYTINASFFATGSTISGLSNQTIYTNNIGSTAFDGGGLWYPVSVTTGTNTENGQYNAIKINSNGFVEDIVYVGNCSGGAVPI